MRLVVPVLPATAQALNVSAGTIHTIQLTTTLYLVGPAIGRLAYRPISDRLGRRPVLLAGLGVFTQAGMATAAALIATGLRGAGFSAMQATLVYLFAPAEMRLRMLGVLSGCIGGGPIGFVLIGRAADAVGARLATLGTGAARRR